MVCGHGSRSRRDAVSLVGSAHHGKQAPGLRHSPQDVAPAVLEPDAGADDEIAYRRRDHYLPGGGHPEDARRNVYRDAAHVVPSHLALAGVDAGAELKAQAFGLHRDRPGAVDRSSRPIEGREVPVARGFNRTPPEPLQLAPHHVVVSVEELAPPTVAQLRGPP